MRMNQGRREKILIGKKLLKRKQPNTPYTVPKTVPCALMLAILNVGSLDDARLIATGSADQYPFSLLYSNPNSTARPKESEHLNAGISLLLLQIPLKQSTFVLDG